jgi:hypothetical protein
MSGFFEELQRRKVYRVAAAYVVVAGFLIQIASAAFPAWELPNWSLLARLDEFRFWAIVH